MDIQNGSAMKTSYEDIRSFFDHAPTLKDGDDIKRKLQTFIEMNCSPGEDGRAREGRMRDIWGTTVPLEQRCVRYIDNFSSGHRGAASTEYFLKAGYSVIFLYRRGSCQPYCRALPDDPLLECFQVTSYSNITVDPIRELAVKRAIANHRAAITQGTLLKLPFTTIFEYLQILQLVALLMRSLGNRALFYLAAAVSDFYVPWETMAMHKIQSSSGPLDMRLAQVPKMLSILRTDWAPSAFCISFKLETDAKILLDKAAIALKNYNVHIVVANELLTRKEEVTVVTKSGNIVVRKDKADANADVEEPLIKLIVERHSAYIISES